LFIALLACLLFFLGLSLAGQFDIGLAMTGKGASLARKQGYMGSFFTGVLATVVATPCMGPFLGAAVGFALAQPVSITFAVFTAMALGLAFPYMLLTAQPAAIRVLPRPGAWMEIFKQFTAVPLFATVIWLSWIYARLFAHTPEGSSGHIVRLLSGFLILAIAGWVLGRWPARWFSTGTAVLLGAIVLVTLITRPKPEALEWQPFSEAALNFGRAQHRPVFIDFTAAWCLSCQFNERAVLHSEEITQQLRSRNFILLKADWTAYDPEITKQLTAIGRSGVPTYVIYPSAPSDGGDVLPEVLTRSAVLQAIERDSQ
jgi:thiol:disulfide interchange protein DsbD